MPGPYRGRSATFTVIDECRQVGKNELLCLLDHKVEQAQKEITADLHAMLYGRKPERNPLRQAIADAYDQVTYNAAISSTLATYKKQITEQIFTESPILTALNRQEKPVSDSNCIARAAVAKRAEKRAARRTDEVGDYLDAIDWEDGDTVAWSVNFKSKPEKTYNYVALRGGESWFITGDGCRYDDDGLTAKLVALSLDGKVRIPDWEIEL
jgi:hypothetical protein